MQITKEEISKLIEKGLSANKISKELNMSYSKTLYWIKKFKLKTKFSNLKQEPLTKKCLVLLINQHLSQREIAEKLNRSQGSIKHWLGKFSLKTKYKKIKKDLNTTEKKCTQCKEIKNISEYYKNSRNKKLYSIYCKKCSSDKVIETRRKNKKKLITLLGGSCIKCGYNKCDGALHIHHTIPELKSKDFSSFKYKSIDNYLEELKTCVLLCANCHAEEHYGINKE